MVVRSASNFERYRGVGTPLASKTILPLVSRIGTDAIAALIAAVTESIVGGCGVCDRSTVTVSLPLVLERLILNISLPVRPGIGSVRLSTRAVPGVLVTLVGGVD